MEEYQDNLEYLEQYNMQLVRDEKIDLIIQKINSLYTKIIEGFRRGDLLVYNPNILRNLTRDKFMNWIICQNKDVSELFDQQFRAIHEKRILSD